jgi:hypothetical protein
MALLSLPDQTYNWFVHYYNGHSHCTTFGGELSEFENISASVIQGSGLGPASYIINTADLHPVHKDNALVKFADDTDLIVAAENEKTVVEELNNIKEWAKTNNLTLNESKSVEIVFRNPNSKGTKSRIPPPTPMNIKRKSEIKTLGVTLTSTFSMNQHISNIIGSCGQALYAMKILKSHGLSRECLQVIFQSTILSRLLYASQAWIGFANEAECSRLESFLNKSKKSSFASADLPTFQTMCDASDNRLFESIRSNEDHVLARLMPPNKPSVYNLRPRSHNFQLPKKTITLIDKNYINRMLYKNIYCK